MGKRKAALFLALVGVAAPAASDPAGELAPPVRIAAAGKAIDTDVGHAAPSWATSMGTGSTTCSLASSGTACSGSSATRERTTGPGWRPGRSSRRDATMAASQRADASASVHSWWTSTATATWT